MTPRPFAQCLSGTRAAVLLAGALSLAGCAVGPNYQTPPPPVAKTYTPQPLPAQTAAADDPAGAAQRLAVGQDISAQWWTLFHSTAINALVEQALKSNADLEAARAALRAAQETYYAQRGSLLPQAGIDYNASRNKASDTISTPLSTGQNPYTLHTAQVTVSYVPDVFGGLRRQVEQTKAQAESQRFQTEAAYLSLTAQVAAAAIQAASLREQLDAEREIVRSAGDVLKIMRRQLDLGEIAGADVASQEYVLAQAQQAVPPLEKQLAQQNDLLDQLVGAAPDQAQPALSLAEMTLPQDLPLSLPSQLVEHRPDIRAAAENLHAASAGVGVAIAARLPAFTLSANAGGLATTLSALFNNGNSFWTLTGDVAQPIFQGGTLLHRQRAAEAALDQAKAQYRSTVLSSLQNVADTLQALDADSRGLQAAVLAEHSAGRSLAIAKSQLEQGEVGGVTVLTAEQAYQTAVASLIQARAGRYADTVALFQSLGGGWWNRKA
jgi:NodT family efflux transporter outer membrane factor (OMF) lipoprotein